MSRSLLLNASMEPHAIVRHRDAVVLYLEDAVDVIEYSGEAYRSPSTTVLVPAVMRLRQYVHLPEKARSIQIITPNVLARDGHECAYCGRTGLTTGPNGNGTMDHVVPRSKGGRHTWENVTACCFPCNARKGHRTLAELQADVPVGESKEAWVARWTLDRTPFRPLGVQAHMLRIKPHPCWEPYLGLR